MNSSRIKKIFFSLILISNVLFAQADWVQIIPTSFSDIYFDSPSLGWAVGSYGIIRKTTDGGENWKTILSDRNQYLNRIEFGQGGGRGYVLSSNQFEISDGFGSDGSVFYSSNGGDNWKRLSSSDDYDFSDVSIDYDAQQGYQIWFATRETILYCKGFSNNFVERRNGINENHSPILIKFIEDQIGWVMATGWDTLSSSIRNYLYHTTDGGLNWNLIHEFDFTISNMRFSLGGVGVVAGFKGEVSYIFRTTDYGYNWDDTKLPEMENCKIFDVIKESDSHRMWIAGEFFMGDIKTSLLFNDSPLYDKWIPDSTFTLANNSINSLIELNRLHLPVQSDGRKLFIAGDDIYKAERDDYSSNWISSQFTLKDYSLNDLYFFDSRNGFSVGNHKGIFKTTDSGDNWKPVVYDENTEDKLFKIFFIDEENGWACGSKGLVMITNDSGATWTEVLAGTQTELHDIYFINENRGIAVGGSSFYIGSDYNDLQSILTTNDGGFSWQVSETQVYYDVFYDDRMKAIFFIDDLEGWIAGGSTILHTTDAGVSWENMYDITPNTGGCYNIQDLYFSDKNSGIAVGGGYPDNVWRTTDGGYTWLDVTWDNQWSHGGIGISDIEFASGKYWAAGSDNIYTSNFYGSMWQLNFQKGYWNSPNSLVMFDENTGFVSGGKSFARRQTPLITNVEINESVSNIIPVDFILSQNYPNPFNPSTSIEYSVPSSQFVSLKVYDILGREIAVLVNQHMNAGNYSVNFNASNLSSGIYFYTLTSGNQNLTRKMLLLR